MRTKCVAMNDYQVQNISWQIFRFQSTARVKVIIIFIYEKSTVDFISMCSVAIIKFHGKGHSCSILDKTLKVTTLTHAMLLLQTFMYDYYKQRCAELGVGLLEMTWPESDDSGSNNIGDYHTTSDLVNESDVVVELSTDTDQGMYIELPPQYPITKQKLKHLKLHYPQQIVSVAAYRALRVWCSCVGSSTIMVVVITRNNIQNFS